jgi:hypothetical protein
VTDDGTPALSSTNSYTVFVNEVNSTPTLAAQPNVTISAGTTLVVTNKASDSDIPANSLFYQLTTAPTNAVIGANGIITWATPTNQTAGTNLFVTVVTDSGVPPLSATNSFLVTVTANSQTPVSLQISVTASNTVVISWPASATGWILQRSASLGTTNGWADMNQTNVLVLGGQNQMVVTNLVQNAFYRLKLSQP